MKMAMMELEIRLLDFNIDGNIIQFDYLKIKMRG